MVERRPGPIDKACGRADAAYAAASDASESPRTASLSRHHLPGPHPARGGLLPGAADAGAAHCASSPARRCRHRGSPDHQGRHRRHHAGRDRRAPRRFRSALPGRRRRLPHSPIRRRQLGLDRPTNGGRRWGIRRHFQIAPWTDTVEVHWAAHTEAYVPRWPTTPSEWRS